MKESLELSKRCLLITKTVQHSLERHSKNIVTFQLMLLSQFVFLGLKEIQIKMLDHLKVI